jgi:hypothetical protein
MMQNHVPICPLVCLIQMQILQRILAEHSLQLYSDVVTDGSSQYLIKLCQPEKLDLTSGAILQLSWMLQFEFFKVETLNLLHRSLIPLSHPSNRL